MSLFLFKVYILTAIHNFTHIYTIDDRHLSWYVFNIESILLYPIDEVDDVPLQKGIWFHTALVLEELFFSVTAF